MRIDYNNIFSKANRGIELFSEGVKFYPKARELSGIIIDGNSALRNTASSVKLLASIPVIAGIVNESAAIGGILGVPNGLSWARDALIKTDAAAECGHIEGVFHHSLSAVSGLSYAGVSGLLASEGIMGLENASILAGITTAFLGLGFAMYGALTIGGAHGLIKSRTFGNALNEQKVKGELETLKWLNSQISLDPAEIEEIEKTAKDPEKEITQRLLKKWSVFELRTNSECAKMVREKVPALLEKFDLEEAQKLIEEVEKANYMQQVKQALFVIISLFGLAAFVAMMVVSGPVSPILFALGALIWLTLDSSKLHNYVGEKCWSWHLGKKEPKPPCQIPLKA